MSLDNNNTSTAGWYKFVTCWPTQDSSPLKTLNADAQFLPDDEVLAYSAEELLDLVYGDVLKRRLLCSAIRAYEKKLSKIKRETHIKSLRARLMQQMKDIDIETDIEKYQAQEDHLQVHCKDKTLQNEEIHRTWVDDKMLKNKHIKVQSTSDRLANEMHTSEQLILNTASKENKHEEYLRNARRQLGFLDFPKSLQEFAKCVFKPRDVTSHGCLAWKRKVNDNNWCKLDDESSFHNPLLLDFSTKLVGDILLHVDIIIDFISALAVKCDHHSLKLWIDFSDNYNFGDPNSSRMLDQSLLKLLALDTVEFVDIRLTMLATIMRRDFFQTIPLKLLEKLLWIPDILVHNSDEWSDMFDAVEKDKRVECSSSAHRRWMSIQTIS